VLAKTFLTCIPEPPRDVQDQAVARGNFRNDRFLKSVGMAMVGDSRAAMAELLGRGHETEGERFEFTRAAHVLAELPPTGGPENVGA